MADTVGKEMAARLAELIAEFRASGKGIDEFVRVKLAASREGGAGLADELLQAFAEIDANYADLTAAKSRGENRREWLRGKLEETVAENGAERKRDLVGEVLSRSADALTGDAEGTTQPVPFDGMDAVDTVDAIDDALAESAHAPLLADTDTKTGEETK